jgi:hypothetical protein
MLLVYFEKEQIVSLGFGWGEVAEPPASYCCCGYSLTFCQQRPVVR